LALPLGNYHNQKEKRGTPVGIGAEHVAVTDFLTEVRLLNELACEPDLMRQASSNLKERLSKRAKTGEKSLRELQLLRSDEVSTGNPLLKLDNNFF
jgi:hypothetical protein